jgi:CBS domain-containing protein
MVGNALTHRPPLSTGSAASRSSSTASTMRDAVDLKHSGIVPIVDLARVYALAGGHEAVNTNDRLENAAQAARSASRVRATCATRWSSWPRCGCSTRRVSMADGHAADNFLRWPN